MDSIKLHKNWFEGCRPTRFNKFLAKKEYLELEDKHIAVLAGRVKFITYISVLWFMAFVTTFLLEALSNS